MKEEEYALSHPIETSLGELRKRPHKLVGKAGLIMLVVGALTIFLSAFSASITLVFIGLSVTFWGLLFTFALPTGYVTNEVLDSMVFSPILALNNVIEDLDLHGNGVYLPPYPEDAPNPIGYLPQNIKRLKGGSVYISAESKDIRVIENEAFTEKSKGAFIVPPGLNLANLLERISGEGLSTMDLLMKRLPGLFVTDLGLAENFKISFDESYNLVHIELDGTVCQYLCRKTSKLKHICPNLGCPFCSSIACLLTRATKKPVTIAKCKPAPSPPSGIRNHLVRAISEAKGLRQTAIGLAKPPNGSIEIWYRIWTD